MFLWHGTYSDCKKEILKDKRLKCSTVSYGDTKEINEFFENHIGFNPRKNCIYFSGDTECADGYEIAFKVNTDDLDLNKLFVGDFSLLNDIYMDIDNKEVIKSYQKYCDTLISYEDYLNNVHNYLDRDIWELEFLYFDDIQVTEKNLD